MTVPLIVLAVCSIALSVVLTPAWPWLHGYLMGEPAHYDIGQLIQPMLFVSLALVAAGIGLGFLFYRSAGESDPLARTQPALFRFLENKMWLDELYAKTVARLERNACTRVRLDGSARLGWRRARRGRRGSALWKAQRKHRRTRDQRRSR